MSSTTSPVSTTNVLPKTDAAQNQPFCLWRANNKYIEYVSKNSFSAWDYMKVNTDEKDGDNVIVKIFKVLANLPLLVLSLPCLIVGYVVNTIKDCFCEKKV